MVPLKRVIIENYRAIERLDLELDPRLNVFFGENAGGKTTVLDASSDVLGGRNSHRKNRRIWLEQGDWRQAGWVFVGVSSSGRPRVSRWGHLPVDHQAMAELEMEQQELEAAESNLAPIHVYYPTERRLSATNDRAPRWSLRADVLEVDFDWFAELEDKERREKLAKRDFDHTLPVLDAIREALARTLPGVSNPRTETDPLRWMVDLDVDGTPTPMELTELSDGYRTHLALVMDLAGRMVQAHPHLGLDSPAVVLIDEVDLHLHPRWQQRVLPDLLRAFPEAQFLVTTHSEQVLSSATSHQIYRLERGPDGLTATHPEFSLGAESGRVSRYAMGVEPRPDNEWTRKLADYAQLVREGQGRGERAMALRRELHSSELAQEPELVRLDMEMRRQARNERLGRA